LYLNKIKIKRLICLRNAHFVVVVNAKM